MCVGEKRSEVGEECKKRVKGRKQRLKCAECRRKTSLSDLTIVYQTTVWSDVDKVVRGVGIKHPASLASADTHCPGYVARSYKYLHYRLANPEIRLGNSILLCLLLAFTNLRERLGLRIAEWDAGCGWRNAGERLAESTVHERITLGCHLQAQKSPRETGLRYNIEDIKM